MTEPTPIEITEAAGDWLDRLSASQPSAADRRAFAEWVRTSPVHIAEFLRLSALKAELTGALRGRDDWAQRLIDEASATIVQISDRDSKRAADQGIPEPPSSSSQPALGAGRRTRWLSAAAMVAIMAAAAIWTLQPERVRTIATEIGEQRTMVLVDGSTLRLNTDSVARVSMGEALREVELEHGELLVDVAVDPHRRMRVRTDEAVIEAVGTRFNVYRRDGTTEVTVVEGRVIVDWSALGNAGGTTAAQPTQRELGEGMRLVVDRNSPQSEADSVDVERATAWTERRLVFDEETVQAVAADFNRYNRTRIIIDDPALAERRISGVFDVDDPAAFVEMLSGLEAVDVQFTPEGHRRVRGRPGPTEKETRH